MDWVLSLIPDISLSTANNFYTWGWIASISGAAITFAGVLFLMWGTRVRDHDFEHNIATLNSEAGAARERAGKLEERAAGLEKETALAKERTAGLEQETTRLKIAAAWRRLLPAQAEAITSALKGQTFELAVYGMRAENDPEAHSLWQEIVAALRKTDLKLAPATILASGFAVSVAGEGPEVEAIKKAFAGAGIVLFDSNKIAGPWKIELHVGTKLPPN
jgi:hypothetical protein